MYLNAVDRHTNDNDNTPSIRCAFQVYRCSININ